MVLQVEIRRAVSSDIPALIAMDHGYSTDHVWQLSLQREAGQIQASFREVRLPRAMRVPYPRQPERLADEWTEKAAILLAEGGGGPLGYVALVYGPAEDSAWITDITVDLPHRGKGIGKQLLLAALEWSRERGMRHLFFEMQSKNYPAIRLAQQAGFTFAGFSDMYYPEQEIALFFAQPL